MDGGHELQLSLNLVADVPHNFSRSAEKTKKNKITGDRRSRVQQRKTIRAQREEDRRQLNPKGVPESNADRKRKHTLAEEESTLKQRKTDGVISSLFRKNPEVPNVEITEVETVTENVFTGRTFADLPIHPYLVSNLEEKFGFKEMTEVQQRTIPVLLRRRDALVKSQTGSGKTLAYAVPIIESLQSRKLKVRRDDGPYALIIVPTRELALQSYDTFVKLLRTFIWIVPGCLMGGEKRKAEKSRLRKGVNILVATPGRLMDHIKTTSGLSLARIQWLVIDEADRLLELGYERDIAQITNALTAQCPDPPHTVLLSATLSEGVERLSSITLKDAERIDMSANPPPSSHHPNHSVQASSDTFTVPSQLRQYFVITPCKLRLVTLASFLLWKCQFDQPGHKLVVFLSTQDAVEFHYRLFTQVLGARRDTSQRLWDIAHGGGDGAEEDVGDSDDEDDTGENGGERKEKKVLKIFQLYGDMDQKARTKTFSEFSEATSGVLLCTDVAARGLDLPNVDWIIQYTSPGSTVDYIHRVGRTARAGTKGHALLFLMPSEAGYLQELRKHKISMSQLQPASIFKHLLHNLDSLPPADVENTARQRPHTQEEAATYLQDRFEEYVLRNKMVHGLAGKGFQSYVRAYATYSKEVKDYFKVGDLHLGHVAKSFALREAPTKVHGVAAKFASKKNERRQQALMKPSKRPLSFKQATLSEYSSGLDTVNTSPAGHKHFGKGKTRKTKGKWRK